MTTPSSHFFYRTTTNLVHPAVLGAIIVNLIQLMLSGDLMKYGPFPVLASVVLVWYFVLDFWVTIINFESEPADYNLPLFLIDLVVLGFLLASFYFLWVMPSDFWFFITLSVQVSAIIIWNHVSGVIPFSIRDRYVLMVIAVACVCLFTAFIALLSAIMLHNIAIYTTLACLLAFLVSYTRNTFND